MYNCQPYRSAQLTDDIEKKRRNPIPNPRLVLIPDINFPNPFPYFLPTSARCHHQREEDPTVRSTLLVLPSVVINPQCRRTETVNFMYLKQFTSK